MYKRPKDDFENAIIDLRQMVDDNDAGQKLMGWTPQSYGMEIMNPEEIEKRKRSELDLFKDKCAIEENLLKQKTDRDFEIEKKRAHLQLEIQARAWEINKEVIGFYSSKAFKALFMVGSFIVACKLIAALIFVMKIKFTYAFYNQAGETVSTLIKDVIQEIKK